MVIVLKRAEQFEGETDAQFLYRVLSGFAKGAEQTADAAFGQGEAAIYKRGLADGLASAVALSRAILEELHLREQEKTGAVPQALRLN